MASILIVDDDFDILKLASHVLAANGHFVFTAQDAQEALEHLDQRPFDLVITDANMPRHSGYDLLSTLKQNTDFKTIPVAFLTGRREKKDIQRAMDLGVCDYLVKPLDPFLLIQKVNQILSQYKKETSEVEIAKTSVSNKAILDFNVSVNTISEVGMEIFSSQSLQADLKINLNSPIFDEIKIKPPFLKVLSCVEDRSIDAFRIKLQFIGMKEKDLTKIRAWMIANTKAVA